MASKHKGPFSTELNTSTGWFVILKLTDQHQMSENWKQLNLTNSGLTWYELKLEKDKQHTKFSNQLQPAQVVSFILTVTTWWIALKHSFDTWQQQTRPEDITKHKYSVKGEKKLSVMGNEGLWKTFWRTLFFVGWFQSYLYFFYCKSLFDCWKNQVIRGIKSHHKFFMNLT